MIRYDSGGEAGQGQAKEQRADGGERPALATVTAEHLRDSKLNLATNWWCSTVEGQILTGSKKVDLRHGMSEALVDVSLVC